jgi:Glyoxalase-like domain
MVDDLDQAACRLERLGWVLDAGSVHRGQGTRNRRLAWPEQYLELLCVAAPAEARANRLRLDRRGDWSATGASPFGFALRGQLPEAHLGDYWLYEELGPRIWVHRDNERAPERPLVLVLEVAGDGLEQRKRRSRGPNPLGHRRPGVLQEVRVGGPSPAFVPPYAGPTIIHSKGPPQLELIVGPGPARPVTEILGVRG